ncbi:MAG TPA: hypothetical protein VNT01_10260 [Symbiobacteriaceae bacterium]|nr:hypothetical protein [Symbiobacteriaceae bacterium]
MTSLHLIITGVGHLPTCHVYRNGQMTGLTVPPATTPMWPGKPIEPDQSQSGIALGMPPADPDGPHGENAMIRGPLA